MNVRFMGSMGLALKQAIVLGVGAAGVIALTAFAVVGSHDGLIAERKAHTRHLVEAATALIAHFEKRAEDGRIPVESAKKEAIAAVQALRTGDDNYFWIIDRYPRMILHPYFPDLQSKSLRDFRDDRRPAAVQRHGPDRRESGQRVPVLLCGRIRAKPGRSGNCPT